MTITISFISLSILITLITMIEARSWDEYNPAICHEPTHWSPLPNPEGVIAFGYNAIRGPVDIQMFNITSYEYGNGNSCRLHRDSMAHDDRLFYYRLPGHVEKYCFRCGNNNQPNRGQEILNLKFTFIIHDSSYDSVLDMTRRWGLIIDRNIQNLSFKLQAPLIMKNQSYPQKLQEIMQSDQNPFYTLIVQYEAGSFVINPSKKSHFTDQFFQSMRHAKETEEEIAQFFHTYGSHFAKEGKFGGLQEWRVQFHDYVDAKCDRNVTIDQLAICDALKIKEAGFQNVQVKQKNGQIDLERSKAKIWQLCKSKIFPIRRILSPVVLAGGNLNPFNPIHYPNMNKTAWNQWIQSIPLDPVSVHAEMVPICEFIPIIDQSDEKSACERRLKKYLHNRNYFALGDAKKCEYEQNKKAVGFEKGSDVITYCVSMKSFDQIDQCLRKGKVLRRPKGGRVNGASTMAVKTITLIGFTFSVHDLY